MVLGAKKGRFDPLGTQNHSCYQKTRNPLHANPMQLLYVQPDVLSKRSPTMEPCTFRIPCYLAPDSFKLELSKINLIWSRTKFLSHRTARRARFYFLKYAQHTIPQHMTSTRSAILGLLYNRVGACIGRWGESTPKEHTYHRNTLLDALSENPRFSG